MITTLILFTIANIILAAIDAHKIGLSTTIKHGINAAVYISMIAIPFFIFHNYFLIVALLLNRLLVFNIALSLFRKLSWDYISLDPASITDKIAKSIFGTNGKLMYEVYGVGFILFTILSFIL